MCSSFFCEKCRKPITENEQGHFISGCEHYPLEIKTSKEDDEAVRRLKELFGMYN